MKVKISATRADKSVHHFIRGANQIKASAFATRAKALCVSLLAAGLVAACGGGGGSNDTPKTTSTTPAPVLNQGLWVANGTNVLEFVPSQLTGGANAAVPHLMNNSSVFGAPQGVTFDGAGNLWVMDAGTPGTPAVPATASMPAALAVAAKPPALYMFTAAQLAALGQNPAPMPTVTITGTNLNTPQQAVFDAQGDLWVADHGTNAVFVYSAQQLIMGGSITPSVTITSSNAFNGPLGIVFDKAGDLWIANNGNNDGTTLFRFDAANLPKVGATASVTLTPDVVLTNSNNSIQGPWALAFDASGNLWSSNAGAPFTLVEFAQGNLGVSGTPAPAITISPTMVGGIASLNAPNGLCFDKLGDLAAADSAGAFGVPFYKADQLLASGATVPNTFIVGTATTLNAPAGCNFGPFVN
jgi:sugar lactone lactonase YvrE